MHLINLLMRYTLLAFLFISFNIKYFAQGESNIWYFGQNAGLDFSSGSPVALSRGQLNTTEGVATICNPKGELLFYTDGITIWNKHHEIMRNGENLMGNPSSTQSAVAVPLPGSTSLYYLFTVDAEAGENGFRYSIIDMSKQNGLGEVIQKNNLLITPCTEKVTAVKHRNNIDFWIITHAWNSNKFLAYPLTDKGIGPPVISSIGSSHEGDDDNTIGYMKTSADGSQLALAVKEGTFVEIFDFDNASGIVSNPIRIDFAPGSKVYGVEFSSNGNLLYITAGGKSEVWQFNLLAGSNDAIAKSGIVVGKTKGWAGALQIAKDGKIYVSTYMNDKLDRIENPDKVGNACGFINGAVDLNGKKATLGFPSFIQSYFTQKEFTQKLINFSEAQNLEKGKEFILSNIYFDTDKYELKSTSYAELNKLVEVLKANPQYSITISGHTDNVGNKSYNLHLSENRAKAVANYLISKGIEESRITTAGYGNSQPIASNDTEDGRKKNRRVSFIIQ
ncbi:MAG: OmpA family protein [Flavobacteriales bacterium]|nr:OmpA family protein [Flavobacteriales bacterium]